MESEVFDSITWETAAPDASATTRPGFRQSTADDRDPHEPKWEGFLLTAVHDPVKELADTKDAYVSYLVSAKTDLPNFTTTTPSCRRRYRDFSFLREHLTKDFPACVVPPLPDKHRIGEPSPSYLASTDPRRRIHQGGPLQLRVSRAKTARPPRTTPILQRSSLLQAFFESSEWTVHMHQHIAHPPTPESSQSLIDNLSDTLLNAFARVRKPDERFVEMRDRVDKFEDGVQNVDRIWSRIRTRAGDLTSDYHDLAVATQGLGFLESGITQPLNHVSNAMLEFSALLRHLNQNATEPFLRDLHSLVLYSHCNRATLKLRDQKQLDFEELSAYLSNVSSERDRLAAIISGRAGSSGLGLGAYLRDRMEAIRGTDDDRSRVEKMRKLDTKIKELQDAVTGANETSDGFSDQTLQEQAIFQYAKEAELKQMMETLADRQIEFCRSGIEEWERIIPILQRIKVDI